MRYIDITTDNITQNLLAIDLEFQSILSNNILLDKSKNVKNLKDATTLDDVVAYVDLLNQNSSSNLNYIDSKGIYYNPENIIFDEIEEIDTTTIKVTGSLQRVVNNINDSIAIYEGEAANLHEFNHNLDSEFLKINVWVKEDIGWQNSITPITIIDPNNIIVQLSKPKKVRIIIDDIKNISKTYGLKG